MSNYELLREAEEELQAAAERYEQRVPRLGIEFLGEVEQAMSWVCEHPRASQLWPDVDPELGIRRKLLNRFPFALPYLQHEDRIIFLAVAHLSRRPAFWLGRAND